MLVPNINELPKVKITEKRQIPPPSATKIMSSTNAEMPLGKIIEGGIFGKERMARVKANTNASANLAEQLKDQGEQLNSAVQECSCSYPKPRCTPCVSGQTCTSDPCKPVRGKIQEIEKNNIEKIEKLKAEEQKTAEEAKNLKAELFKLERAEKFMKDCPVWALNSLAEFLIIKDYSGEQKWQLTQIKFWDSLNILINKAKKDWATFYCPVGGTLNQLYSSSEISSVPKIESPVIPEEIAGERMACRQEIPVGEIIDRSKRIANKLIGQLETLIALDRKIIKAVDEMQISASQCTSQRCTSICIKTKLKCIKSCQGTPCPFGDIAAKSQAIAEIQSQIKKLAEEKEKLEMGIIPLIDEIVSEILKITQDEVRTGMQNCALKETVELEDPKIAMPDCERAVQSVGPKGEILRLCCLEEPEYQQCLNSCYLETQNENYENCLQNCLTQKSREKNKEEIAYCRNRLNFFCCTPPKN